MPTHPGHPALALTDTLVDSRGYINNAIDSISVQTITGSVNVSPDSGRYIMLDPASSITVTLPDPSDDPRFANIRLALKRHVGGANTITVRVNNSGTIDGASAVTMNTQYDTLVVFNDGTAATWYQE